MEKRCTQCGEVKPLDEFYRDYKEHGRLKAACKVCERRRHQMWKKRNRRSQPAEPVAEAVSVSAVKAWRLYYQKAERVMKEKGLSVYCEEHNDLIDEAVNHLIKPDVQRIVEEHYARDCQEAR